MMHHAQQPTRTRRLAVSIEDDIREGQVLIRLQDVPGLPWMPRPGGKELSGRTIQAWCTDGMEYTGGGRIPMMTTPGAILRFFAACSAASAAAAAASACDDDASTTPPGGPATPPQRR